MKLSPKLQYNIVFWMVTIPILIPILVVLLIAYINPLWFRTSLLQWTVDATGYMGKWRDRRTVVKYYHDKMNLFNILKG